jgi:transcriptional regulator with XRE-family HTH domain
MALTLRPAGDEIRERRTNAGLSQQRLAELAACSISTVRLVENGWQPSDVMLDRLLIALNDERAPATARVVKESAEVGDGHDGT